MRSGGIFPRFRTLALVGLCVLSLASQAEARHRWIFVDFDADGHRDRVMLDAREPWIVRIWLSATRSTHVIRSAQPLREIAAVDLNGDRRPELIASNHSRGLQVWAKAASGFVAYPHRPRPPTRDISGSARHHVDDQTDGLPAGIASGTVTLAVAVSASDRSPATDDKRRPTSLQPRDARSTFSLAPLAPRPPPVLI